MGILKASRANFTPASIIPFLIGAACARQHGFRVPGINVFLGLSAVVSAHLCGNLLNDYFDYKSGSDNINKNRSPFFGGSGLIQNGTYKPAQILHLALAFLLICFLCALGIFLITKNIAFLYICLLAGILTVEYTAPPLRLSYNRLGELDIFFLFGVLLVMGSFYLFSGKLTLDSFLISLPIAFLVLAIIICNEVPDFLCDFKTKKYNLLSVVGREKGFILYGAAIFLSFVSIVINIARGSLPPISAGIIFFYFIGIKAAYILKSELSDIKSLTQASKMTIMLHALAGVSMIFLILKKQP